MSRHCRITRCVRTPIAGRRLCSAHKKRIALYGDPDFTQWTVADDTDIATIIREQRPAAGLTRLERVKVGQGLSSLGLPATEVARILGVTERTVYRWRATTPAV